MSQVQGARGPRVLPPVGPTLGICYQIIDLGTQVEDGPWGEKQKRKVRLTFELPNETHTFREENGEEPFVVSMEIPVYSTEKSNWFKLVKSWTGKELTPDFDIESLLGKPGMVNIVHKEHKGETYANIEGVMPVPKGFTVPKKGHNPCVYWGIENGEDAFFETLPDFLKKKINACLEWNTEKPDDNPNRDKEPEEDPEVPF